MSIRVAGPIDLPRVVAFLARTRADEGGIVASALPVPLAGAMAGSWIRYVPSLLGLDGRLRVHLDEQRGVLQSVAVVHSGRRPEWVILVLATRLEQGGADSAVRLLVDLAAAAARRGITRIFAAAPDRPSAHETLFQAGFYSYTRESWLMLARAILPEPSLSRTARPATSADAHDLFRAYISTTPQAVRRAEQLQMQDFDVGRRDAFDASHHAGGDPLGLRRAAVITDPVGDRARAVALAYAGRERHPHVIRVRTAEGDVEGTQDLARIVARSLPAGRPIAAPVRAYEQHVSRALLADGFEDVGTAMLFVKELAIRIEEPAFAPVVVR